MKVVTSVVCCTQTGRKKPNVKALFFNQPRPLAEAIIARCHYSICESITSLLNCRQCVQRLSKVHCTIVWLRNFLAFIVSSGKPPMNTVRAARVETRKLKQTHL